MYRITTDFNIPKYPSLEVNFRKGVNEIVDEMLAIILEDIGCLHTFNMNDFWDTISYLI